MKYQVMRDLTESEYIDLKESIIQNGVIVPVIVDENGDIIDGHHRAKICMELGITDFPTERKIGLTEEEKRELAYQLNQARRHLTPEQKRQEIRRHLTDSPELSDRQIAKKVDVSHVTVGEHRRRLESTGHIDQLETSIGADGKERPRQVERKPVEETPPFEDYDEEQIGIEETFEEDEENGETSEPTKIIDVTDYFKKREEQKDVKFWNGDKILNDIDKIIKQVDKLNFTNEDFDAIMHWHEDLESSPDDIINYLSGAIRKLQEINFNLIERNRKYNAKRRY